MWPSPNSGGGLKGGAIRLPSALRGFGSVRQVGEGLPSRTSCCAVCGWWHLGTSCKGTIQDRSRFNVLTRCLHGSRVGCSLPAEGVTSGSWTSVDSSDVSGPFSIRLLCQLGGACVCVHGSFKATTDCPGVRLIPSCLNRSLPESPTQPVITGALILPHRRRMVSGVFRFRLDSGAISAALDKRWRA